MYKIKKIDEPTQSWSINQRGSTCPYGNCNQYEPLLLVYFSDRTSYRIMRKNLENFKVVTGYDC